MTDEETYENEHEDPDYIEGQEDNFDGEPDYEFVDEEGIEYED
uniref:Uncharacterized protein n=1 Tax=Arundo donax TaxID=35708 RepID=A0A0A8YNR1_ARUDO